MEKTGKALKTGFSTFVLAVIVLCGLQMPAFSQSTQTSGSSAASAPQAAQAKSAGAAPEAPTPSTAAEAPSGEADAYYHFMLGRRYQELAGAYNRGDLVAKAIQEYEQAIQDDPKSLFLHVELAGLYSRNGRIADAVKEAEGVLKADPNNADAHRLLATIYLHNLGEAEGNNKPPKESLRKAIEHLEALTRIDPKDINNFVTLGRLYRLSGDDAKAEETFKRALGSDPDSKEALTYLAQLYTDQGNDKDAIDALKKIPDSDTDAGVLAMLGQAYSQAHDFTNASAAYDKALAQDPDNEEIRQSYAEALMSAGKVDDARAQLQQIVRDDPENGVAHLRLGRLDRVQGKFDDARQELERAQKLLPDPAEALYEQAALEQAEGNYDKSIQILDGLLKSSEKPDGQYTAGEAGNRAIFLGRLGEDYRTQQKYDLALAAFRQMATLGKAQAPQAEVQIIETLRVSRQPQQAMAEADSALKAYPSDHSLLMVHATLLGEQGRVDDGVKELQPLLKGTHDDIEVLLTIAQIYSQAKRYPDALATAQKVQSLAKTDQDHETAHFLLGSVYERQKSYDRAEEEFKRVLAIDPLNSSAANYLGYMLAERGVRLDESVKYIQKALEADPNNGAYLDSLGWAYFKMHRYDLAEGPLEKAARLMTGDPTILEHLGNLHLQMGKDQQAAEDWERALKDWPSAVGSDFDASEATALQQKLDALKLRLAKKKQPSGLHD